MFNLQAFKLLQNALRDSRSLFLHYFTDWDADISDVDGGLRSRLIDSESHYDVLRGILRELPPATILSLRDRFLMNYVLFRGDGKNDFYSIGPFRSLPLEEADIIQLRRENSLSTDAGEELRALLLEAPCNITRVEGLAVARSLLLSFYDISQPEIIEKRITAQAPSIILQGSINHRAKQLEESYSHEERLAISVAQGNYKNAVREGEYFLRHHRNSDAPGSCVSHRSYMYAVNTIFRKAAGGIGIHPVYLDNISRRYAQKISLSVTHSQLDSVYLEMIEDYCRLCSDHPSKQYSQSIQQIMNYVLFHLSDDLSPSSIAQAVNYSPGHISKLFKTEVGISLMTYISKQRINTAKKLLRMTQMPIREVAGYVGIPDWNYFTKLFKKAEGCTPSEYQKNVKSVQVRANNEALL